MRCLKACLLVLLCLESVPLFAQDAAPECQVAPGLESSFQGNAGCVVKIDNKMLLVRHRGTGRVSPPGGTAAREETAQCTAHRETWEETGVEVKVGALLKQFSDPFYLFHCSAVDEDLVKNPKTRLPVPTDFEIEVTEVLFSDPTGLGNDLWRFPEQAPVIREVFKNLLSQNEEDF